jgi:hypothetical protein
MITFAKSRPTATRDNKVAPSRTPIAVMRLALLRFFSSS